MIEKQLPKPDFWSELSDALNEKVLEGYQVFESVRNNLLTMVSLHPTAKKSINLLLNLIIDYPMPYVVETKDEKNIRSVRKLLDKFTDTKFKVLRIPDRGYVLVDIQNPVHLAALVLDLTQNEESFLKTKENPVISLEELNLLMIKILEKREFQICPENRLTMLKVFLLEDSVSSSEVANRIGILQSNAVGQLKRLNIAMKKIKIDRCFWQINLNSYSRHRLTRYIE